MTDRILQLAQTQEIDITNPADWWAAISGSVESMVDGFLRQLPILLIALVTFIIGRLAISRLMRVIDRALERSSWEPIVEKLASIVARYALLLILLLITLSIAGINVGAALAGLGIAGLALAFAVQNLIENFVSGILVLLRKPFVIGDQVQTGDLEGTVEDIDIRVTTLRDYDGETILVPNRDVWSNAVINYTRRESRRSRVSIGVDYRDDHNEARRVIGEVIGTIEGVLPEPAPRVLIVELGTSSVDFEVQYWTAPDITSVVVTRDRVLGALKSAVEGAGLTIPWPIRTLVFDNRLSVGRES